MSKLSSSLLPPKPGFGYECVRVVPAGVGLAQVMQQTGCPCDSAGQDAAAVWLVEDGAAYSELQLGALREVMAHERQGALSREVW